ncbi:hypothetical protein [Trinickia fusca]|uniref:Uncharacterized protein n=1 Tax=Trinickia fusca TaxID=2419777 RepID=A0A494X4G8_9BURK|nr:hypothetical protein [Trinickia fusca]RKP44571.1 hypothetical protein D7S89_22085 [Trinickia fusca]
MSDIRYDSFAQSDGSIGEEHETEAANEQQKQQQVQQQTQAQHASTDATRMKRQQMLRMRQAAARRRAGLQLSARFAAARAAAERTRGSRAQKLLSHLKPRKEAAHGEGKAHGQGQPHEAHYGQHAHGHQHVHAHAHGSQDPNVPQHGIQRLDRDGNQNGGRQQQQQQEDERPPVVKVKVSNRISPSAIRSDMRQIANSLVDEPLKLETETRLAWTRRCVDFGSGLAHDPSTKVTSEVLGSSLDLIGARARHPILRDATRQTGLLGVKHQLQSVLDEPGQPRTSHGSLSERQQDLNVLRPLLVLSFEHPSTPRQLPHKANRLKTLLLTVGPRGAQPPKATLSGKTEPAMKTTPRDKEHDDASQNH